MSPPTATETVLPIAGTVPVKASPPTVGPTATKPTGVSTANTLSTPLTLSSSSPLLAYPHFDSTTNIGTEFPRSDLQLTSLLSAPNSDELIRDLATLISRRNVVFFRAQRLTLAEQKLLATRLGELTGKPSTSTLHIHPSTREFSELGDEISVISSHERLAGDRAIKTALAGVEYHPGERSHFASDGWHSDITFEPTPSDYAILKVRELPTTGGDTIWASGYEVYDRLSPAYRDFLSNLSAIHNATFFKTISDARGFRIRGSIPGEIRGAPENTGESLTAVHPAIRTNPVTGWNSVFLNKGFTKRVKGLSKDESDDVLEYIQKLVTMNHDLQVRFTWRKYEDDPEAFDVAIWDNRSSYHTATDDYIKSGEPRVGDRVVSLGEKPYYDAAGKSRREDLGLSSPLEPRYY